MEKYGYIRDKLILELSKLAFTYGTPADIKKPQMEYVTPPKSYWKLVVAAAGAVLGLCMGLNLQQGNNATKYVVVGLFVVGVALLGLLVGSLVDKKVSSDAAEKKSRKAYNEAMKVYEAKVAEDKVRVDRELLAKGYVQSLKKAVEDLPKISAETADTQWDAAIREILASVKETAKTVTEQNLNPEAPKLAAFIAEYPKN